MFEIYIVEMFVSKMNWECSVKYYINTTINTRRVHTWCDIILHCKNPWVLGCEVVTNCRVRERWGDGTSEGEDDTALTEHAASGGGEGGVCARSHHRPPHSHSTTANIFAKHRSAFHPVHLLKRSRDWRDNWVRLPSHRETSVADDDRVGQSFLTRTRCVSPKTSPTLPVTPLLHRAAQLLRNILNNCCVSWT